MYRIIVTILFIFLSCKTIFAQATDVDFPCAQMIAKGQFAEAEKKIMDNYANDSTDALSCYAAYRLYASNENPGRNLEKANAFLTRCINIYNSLDAKGKAKCEKKNLNGNSLQNGRSALDFGMARKTNTVEAYQQFIDLHPGAQEIAEAKKMRNALAYKRAESANTISAYEEFIRNYPSGKESDMAQERIYTLAYDEAKRTNTEEAYRNYVQKYPNSPFAQEAEERANVIQFNSETKTGDWVSYKKYISRHPENKELVEVAKNEIYEIAQKTRDPEIMDYCAKKLSGEKQDSAINWLHEIYANNDELVQFQDKYGSIIPQEMRTNDKKQIQYNRMTKDGDWTSYKIYISKNKSNIELVEAAKNKIFEIAMRTRDVAALDYCVKNCSGEMKDSAVYLLHEIYMDCGDISKFRAKYKSYTPKSLQEKDKLYKSALPVALKLLETKDKDSLMTYIPLLAPYHIAYEMLTIVINEQIKSKKWYEALKIVKNYETLFAGSSDYASLVKMLEAPAEKDIKVTNIGNAVNTLDGHEYSPVISADDKTLYFTACVRDDNVGGEDIFVSERDAKGRWGKAHIISELCNEQVNEGVVAISADGNTLLLFKETLDFSRPNSSGFGPLWPTVGFLFSTEKTAEGWSEPKELSRNINMGDWQGDASVSSDGRAFLFASESKSKSELEMSTNIFVSLLDKNGNWGKAIDLGPRINTPGTDRSPFLHPDMKTLYFSSDRHSSLGGLDVFVSKRLGDDCWDCWSEPVNMGKEINTVDNDYFYIMSTDGKTAYFSNNDDIYTMNIPKRMRPDPVATISGKLADKDDRPVEAEIRWEDLQSGETVGCSNTDPTNGQFFIVLPLGKIYGYYVDNDSYFPISNSLDLRNEESSVKVENDISMVSYEQMIGEGVAVPINNLFFNTAKSNLLPYSIPELRRVAEIIKSKHLTVEIAGHTDNVGDGAMNQRLSEQRAESVKNFFVGEGCNPAKLKTVGYGSTRPVASNKTEEGRKQNRRVEIKFVGN
ncbi:MAG: OmpA family protein [Bacteroidales bacterium]|nr:OmpA family protein [Bacteroidales bacterium]